MVWFSMLTLYVSFLLGVISVAKNAAWMFGAGLAGISAASILLVEAGRRIGRDAAVATWNELEGVRRREERRAMLREGRDGEGI